MNPIRRLAVFFKTRLRAILYRIGGLEMSLALRQLKHRSLVRAGSPPLSPFPPRSKAVAGEIQAERVLVLAPHPDDELIGLGGMLARYLEAGSRVTVLYLTDGRGPVPEDSTLVALRREEARRISAAYGFTPIFWDIPDNHLQADEETAASLAGVLDQLNADSIYLTSFFDHQFDHFAANQLLAAALKKAPAQDPVIYGYEVWDNIPFPNFLVDVSDYFEKKAEMLSLYAVPNEVTDFVELCRHRSALHFLLYINSMRREPEGYAEAFYRLDRLQYLSLFTEYEQLLQEQKSPLLRTRQSGFRHIPALL